MTPLVTKAVIALRKRGPVEKVLDNIVMLYSVPGTWTQGTHARDWNGDVTDSLSPKAVSWCLLGAIEMNTVGNSDAYFKTTAFIGESLQLGSRIGISNWNDSIVETQDEIVRNLKRVRRQAREANV